MVVIFVQTHNFYVTTLNALRQVLDSLRTREHVRRGRTKITCNEQDYQKQPNGVDLTRWKPQLKRTYESTHKLISTSSCLTPSPSLPLNQRVRTYQQKKQLKQNQLTETTGTNETHQPINKRKRKMTK